MIKTNDSEVLARGAAVGAPGGVASAVAIFLRVLAAVVFLFCVGNAGAFQNSAESLYESADGGGALSAAADSVQSEVVKLKTVALGGDSLTPKCANEGDEYCWKKIANKAACYVLDDYYYPSETVTWSGGCKNEVVDGRGIVEWDGEGSWLQWSGGYGSGKKQGEWIEKWRDSRSQGGAQGNYVDGKKQGGWISETYFLSGGDDMVAVAVGGYVGGEKHGKWVWTFSGATGVLSIGNGKTEKIYEHGETIKHRYSDSEGNWRGWKDGGGKSDSGVFSWVVQKMLRMFGETFSPLETQEEENVSSK